MLKINNLKSKRIVLILFFSLFLSYSNCQEINSSADKYRNIYKKFIYDVCPLSNDSINHFVYLKKNRESLKNHMFLQNSRIKGAQIMYSWKDLEPRKGIYDFTIIRDDYTYLKKNGKKLFIQIQDATFSPIHKAVPNYLLTDEYDGGVSAQINSNGLIEGWVAKRWNSKVGKRFALLLAELGKEFDGKIEGVNLQETAIDVDERADKSFSEVGYLNSLKENMLCLKRSFPKSTTMIYANFFPGEWLPWDDRGYLREIFRFGQEIGVGLGAPDLMVNRDAQLNHALGLMHEGNFTVPIGIAVQDGNYVGKTGADLDYEESSKIRLSDNENIVPILHAFAKQFLKVQYIFWVDQSPYFERDVMPCLTN